MHLNFLFKIVSIVYTVTGKFPSKVFPRQTSSPVQTPMMFSQWYPLDTEHESRSAFIERYCIVLHNPSGEDSIKFVLRVTIKVIIPFFWGGGGLYKYQNEVFFDLVYFH